MSALFDRIYLHLIFCARHASDPLQAEWIRPIEEHLITQLQHQKQPLLGMAVLPDHIHLLVRYRPGKPLGGLIRYVKHSSKALLLQEFPLTAAKFEWQKGYAAFSVSSQRVEKVRSYLQEQSRYHHHFTVEEEMMQLVSNL